MSKCFGYCNGVFRVYEGEVLGAAAATSCSEWVWDLISWHTTDKKQVLGESIHGTAVEKQLRAVIKTIGVTQ